MNFGCWWLNNREKKESLTECRREWDEQSMARWEIHRARDLKTRINKHIKFHGLIVAKNENDWHWAKECVCVPECEKTKPKRKFNNFQNYGIKCWFGGCQHRIMFYALKISSVKFSLNFWCVCRLNGWEEETQRWLCLAPGISNFSDGNFFNFQNQIIFMHVGHTSNIFDCRSSNAIWDSTK